MEIVPSYLASEAVRKFFVAVRRNGGSFRLSNPLSPFQREYVIALTANSIVVLWLRRPGVLRASIGGVVYKAGIQQAKVEWIDGRLMVDDVSYEPIAFTAMTLGS